MGRDEMRLLCGHKGNTEGEEAGLKRNQRYKKREQVRKKERERARASLLSRSCLPRQESGKGRVCVLCV